VSASAPQLESASFVGRLFLFFNLAAVLIRWDLKENVRSCVTPKNVGYARTLYTVHPTTLTVCVAKLA